MSENTNERLRRYAEAVWPSLANYDYMVQAEMVTAERVMAVADAEQAELEAEVAKWRSSYATLCRALVLAKRDSEAAEAERDRARSLAATLEARLAQVEELHIPCSEHPTCADDDNFCHECGQDSPCTTARFLHPEESA